MTVCLAALAENGKKLIVASDRMVTSPIATMSYQWQSEDVQKITQFGNNLVLISGLDVFGRSIISTSIKKCTEQKIAYIEDIVEVFRTEFQTFRVNNFVQNNLQSRGLTLEKYYQLHNTLASSLVTAIDGAIGTWQIGVDLIVAGKSQNQDFHIYSISHPGVSLCHDMNGYVCIGAGGPHAMYHIIGSGYKKSSNETEIKQIIEAAKKKGEAAPGVGTYTDCRIISS